MKKKFFNFFKKAILWFFGLTIGLVVVYRFVPVPLTPLMLIRLFDQAFDSERHIRLYKDWEPKELISSSLPLAVVAAEDQLFTQHNGFDFNAINKALKFNEKKKGKKIRGGSTISQQCAKNVFLWPGRSWFRKGLEAYFTFLIELVWSKERILEVYLNVIEFGDGVYGAEAAAQNFFQKPANKLSANQAALLAAVLPNPIRYKVHKPTSYIGKRKNWILRNMRNIRALNLEWKKD
jgi:monofunctional glycosyltransferase